MAPSPLPESFITLPSLATRFIPPCILPWPFRSFCPSKIIGYGDPVDQKVLQRRAKAGFLELASTKDIVPLRKDLMEGVLLKPSSAPESVIGSIFLSIGREDSFTGDTEGESHSREVKTTGWVVVRFIPRPSGIRLVSYLIDYPPNCYSHTVDGLYLYIPSLPSFCYRLCHSHSPYYRPSLDVQ